MRDRPKKIVPLALALLFVWPIANVETLGQSQDDQTAPKIDPDADRALRAMGDYLKAAEQYTFEAEITYDVLLHRTQMIQYGGSTKVAVKRPGQLRAEFRGDERNSSLVIGDGQTAVLNLNTDLYTLANSPATIDDAVDQLFETYGISVPIADFVYADPYAVLTESISSGFYVGLHKVDGTPCHHLAFSQRNIDWQIWIDAGPRPVPRKLLITYKTREGAPQYAARFTKWDLQTRISPSYFVFSPPAGADRIEFFKRPADVPADDKEAN